jgi:cation diffusion facilitator CzcD-associated flavoprotein CzcO
MKLQREGIFWFNELVGRGFTGNEQINRIMRSVAVRRLTKHVKDPALRRRLTPGYKIGCKRILVSNEYYKTFNRENVSLVTEPIDTFTPEGIVAGGLQHLIDRWASTGAEAYLGTTVAGYPNLCFILGPNTGLGSNSVVHMMESQMTYIMHYIRHLEKGENGSYIDLKPEVQKKYNQDLQRKFKGTVWSSGCKSWYLNRAGKNTTLFPRLASTFRRLTKRFDPTVYRHYTATVKKQQTATSL